MAIFLTGDTHGDFSRLLPVAFHEQRDLTKEDYLILCGDFGGVWVNEIRFSNIFIEKRISSCSQSLEKSRLFSFAPLMREGENSRNAKLILLHKVAI